MDLASFEFLRIERAIGTVAVIIMGGMPTPTFVVYRLKNQASTSPSSSSSSVRVMPRWDLFAGEFLDTLEKIQCLFAKMGM
jgi:hypothetical protein